MPDKDFSWQSEYGVLSVSESMLSKVVAYVLNQKKHHAEDNLFDLLENFGVPLTPDGKPSVVWGEGFVPVAADFLLWASAGAGGFFTMVGLEKWQDRRDK